MAELPESATDPTKIVTFAVGDPFPRLEPQDPRDGINFTGVFFDSPKRYVLKKAHFSLSDHRIFDYDTGRLVVVSHHPGKNPFGAVDPLDLAGTDGFFSFMGEWESFCNVTAYEDAFQSFKVRPQGFSRHGRQHVMAADDTPILNVAKIGLLKSLSLRKQFSVGRREDHEAVYKCSADFLNRTIQVTNEKGQAIAQLTKSSSNIILTAALGIGQETIIDIAPGVDCSAVLCLVIGLKQVGVHYAKDAFNNFVKEPLTGLAVDEVEEQVTGGDEDETQNGGDEGNENEDGVVDVNNGDTGDAGDAAVEADAEISDSEALEDFAEVPDFSEMPDLSAVADVDISGAAGAVGGLLQGGDVDDFGDVGDADDAVEEEEGEIPDFEEFPDVGEVPDLGEMPDLSAFADIDVSGAADAVGGLLQSFFG